MKIEDGTELERQRESDAALGGSSRPPHKRDNQSRKTYISTDTSTLGRAIASNNSNRLW